jgi:hypothetical protein
MNMELIHQIEQRALPKLNRISNGLEAEFPKYEFRVFSNSGGDLTPNPWHVIGVSCLFHKDWDNLPNEVMIQIAAYSLKSTPKLWAGIVWGDTLEAEYQLFATLVPADSETLEKIDRALPDLVEELKKVIHTWRSSK